MPSIFDWPRPQQPLQEDIICENVADNAELPNAHPVEPEQIDRLSRALVVFGNNTVGKSFFLKKILTRLHIDSSSIRTGVGEGGITLGIHHYSSPEPVKFDDGSQLSFSFFDTEGLYRPLLEGHTPTADMKPAVLSVVTATPGVLIFMVKGLSVFDQRMLKVITSMVGEQHRIVVIHNERVGFEEKADVEARLLAYANLRIFRNADNSLVSFVNNLVIDHFLLFNYSGTKAIAHNELVEKTIVNYMRHSARPIIVENAIAQAEQLNRCMSQGIYSFCFKTNIGQVYVRFRFVLDFEMRGVIPTNEDRSKYRVFIFRGPVNLESITMTLSTDTDDRRHFVDFSMQDHEEALAPVEVKITVWTPCTVVQEITPDEGDMIVENSRKIFVRVVA
mmetsp:Transcript_22079/g.32179  ORF Transcript_22079/g.32179 Transcript_22079/m.32179 type:complete len:390 (-) Transcript_22079:306-1475(-)|eukprot:CAMPEP_0185024522 /NCGR_PEP_ID=MMETSP1103-20130426/7624_1 /TAXON_ID=36769 /ORGANISM="Paraphysomonas bandaiensis, Strain Caron Lab Isolate" /LENGTH=389 /DNA_ID=CAMNT_0027557517 /DNA_START=59 /DNA_END=1228 /DNA_ORIENTATION=+